MYQDQRGKGAGSEESWGRKARKLLSQLHESYNNASTVSTRFYSCIKQSLPSPENTIAGLLNVCLVSGHQFLTRGVTNIFVIGEETKA